MHDPRVIANAILSRAERFGVALTNLDIQKLVYFVHGESLRKRGTPLVHGEFEAWQFGPVHRVLYDAFRRYEDAPIEAPAQRFDPVRRQYHPLPPLDDPEAIELLDSTLPRYLQIPTFMLVQITHAKGTPWSRTMEAAIDHANVGMVIGNDLIARHFEGGDVKMRMVGSRPSRKPARTRA
jgi:uncharacterized phage-associated protein